MDQHYGDLPHRAANGRYEARCSCGTLFTDESRYQVKRALDAHLYESEEVPALRYEAGANDRRFLRTEDFELAEVAAYKLLDRESGEAWILDRHTGERTVLTDRRAVDRRVERAS